MLCVYTYSCSCVHALITHINQWSQITSYIGDQAGTVTYSWFFIPKEMCIIYSLHTDPDPPTNVSVVAGTECSTADVSWSPSQVNYSAAIGNYSVRYRLRGSSGGYTTVYSSNTSVTLQGLDPSANYDVEVAAIDLCRKVTQLCIVCTYILLFSGWKGSGLYTRQAIFSCVHIVHQMQLISLNMSMHASCTHLAVCTL